MDISKYALFADVADTGNFTKSGERMGYTQPGVSHILKAMESEFGFPLFVRTKQGVVPTHNAEAILPLVRQLLAVNEQLEQTVSSLNGLTKGHLTIASFASIGRSWLPTVIHTYQQKFPGIEIELLEGGTDDIVHWVENSRADFGLLSKWNVDSLEANNLGISMLPNLVIGNARAQIQALPLEPNFSRELGIGIRSYAGLSPAAQQFIATIQEHINTF